MDRKNLLITSCLTCLIIILAITITIIIPTVTNTSTTILSSTTNPEEYLTYFDNSTPKRTAISTARLNDGRMVLNMIYHE
jgi:hypothetical protein